MTPKPWVVYTRVSTDKQAERGASLKAQLAACEAMAKAHGYRTVHVADEGESAKDVAQPGLVKVREMAARGEIAGVMVYKLDRVARNTRGLLDLLEGFARQDVQFTSVREHIDTSGAAGRLIVTVLAALAQFEREQLSERIRATNEYRKTQGAWIAGAAPIGCATELRGKLRYLIPHPLWGHPVSLAWKLVLEGKSLADVCAALQAVGVPTTSAKRASRKVWAKNAISAVLANPSYIGVLVSEDDFERVRVLLGTRQNPRNHKGKPRTQATDRLWRLAGMAICAHCDSTLTSHTARGRGGRAYPYLRCTGRLHRGRSFCSAKDLPAELWEDKVVAEVADYLKDRTSVLSEIQKAIARRKDGAGPARERVDSLRAQRDDVKSRLDRALTIALEGGAAARAVAPRLAALQSEIEGLDCELSIAEGALAGAEIPLASLEYTASILANSADGLVRRPRDEQRAVLIALRTHARLAADAASSVTISIPYLEDNGSPWSAKGNHISELGEPLSVVVVPILEQPCSVRRWYRRPTIAWNQTAV